MTKKPNLTIDDIARELGVSKTTVSRAISGKGRIGNDTRNKIIAYANKHNYRPSAAAKGLAERRTRNLMLVVPENLPGKTVLQVWEDATQYGYHIFLCYATQQGKAALVRALDNRATDGVILAVRDSQLAELFKKRKIPFSNPEGCRELLRKLDPGSGQID